jgi:hypothetical protein
MKSTWFVCYTFIDINNGLYWYNFVLYRCDAIIIIKWLKQLMTIVYTECFRICVLIVINKQRNKQINNSLSITEKCNMEKST